MRKMFNSHVKPILTKCTGYICDLSPLSDKCHILHECWNVENNCAQAANKVHVRETHSQENQQSLIVKDFRLICEG